MNRKIVVVLLSLISISGFAANQNDPINIQEDFAPDENAIAKQPDGVLFYHEIKSDKNGNIIPWCDNMDAPHCYDHVLNLVTSFWKNINTVSAVNKEGKTVQLPYYMLHQVWKPEGDTRGIAGDQISMAMSSWRQYYAYSGDESIKENMKFMADYYLKNSLSPHDAKWPDLPFPYNVNTSSGVYDGDMIDNNQPSVDGPADPNSAFKGGVLQPDKDGSFALELVHLYKMSKNDPASSDPQQITPAQELQAAIRIAQVLMGHMVAGDNDSSPLPFKVNAVTGEVAPFLSSRLGDRTVVGTASYTTNWYSTMQLFLDLQKLDPSNAREYNKAFNTFLTWMKNYPLKTNSWGPFFEDVSAWSDTQINATTGARFILEHKEYFPEWKANALGIFDWVYRVLGDRDWIKYGVVIPVEQTSYRVPGESHTARQAAAELLYGQLTGDSSRDANAQLQLNWSTYMVDVDGKNVFPSNEIWMSDGYGDYVRHYLNAMATRPALAPNDANHILSTSSVIQSVKYSVSGEPLMISYQTFDNSGQEEIRMTRAPKAVYLNGNRLSDGNHHLRRVHDERSSSGSYNWAALPEGGGVLQIDRSNGSKVLIQ